MSLSHQLNLNAVEIAIFTSPIIGTSVFLRNARGEWSSASGEPLLKEVSIIEETLSEAKDYLNEVESRTNIAEGMLSLLLKDPDFDREGSGKREEGLKLLNRQKDLMKERTGEYNIAMAEFTDLKQVLGITNTNVSTKSVSDLLQGFFAQVKEQADPSPKSPNINELTSRVSAVLNHLNAPNTEGPTPQEIEEKIQNAFKELGLGEVTVRAIRVDDEDGPKPKFH